MLTVDSYLPTHAFIMIINCVSRDKGDEIAIRARYSYIVTYLLTRHNLGISLREWTCLGKISAVIYICTSTTSSLSPTSNGLGCSKSTLLEKWARWDPDCSIWILLPTPGFMGVSWSRNSTGRGVGPSGKSRIFFFALLGGKIALSQQLTRENKQQCGLRERTASVIYLAALSWWQLRWAQ